MTDGAQADTAAAVGDGREITARFAKDQLVLGWREREARVPRVTPVIRFAARTDLGRVRENNEDKYDFYEPEDPTVLAARGAIYAVADGMGGHAAGQIASELALKQVLASYYDSATDDIPEALVTAVSEANERIYNVAVAIPERTGMGTTLSLTAFVEDCVYVAQVGDSRAYLLRDGGIRQVTEDHSWVAEQVRMGGMTQEEAATSPYRNVITRSIGTQSTVDVDVFREEAHVGDTWVLCSDGLTGHVEPEEILQIAGDQFPCEACRQLVELAIARGGRDNVTVVVVSVRGLVESGSAPSNAPEGQASLEPAPVSEEVATKGHGLRRLFGR